MHQLELQILSILLVMGDIVPHPCITQDLGIIVFGLVWFFPNKYMDILCVDIEKYDYQ